MLRNIMWLRRVTKIKKQIKEIEYRISELEMEYGSYNWRCENSYFKQGIDNVLTHDNSKTLYWHSKRIVCLKEQTKLYKEISSLCESML